MPIEPKDQFCFVFDKSGILRLADNAKSLEFLDAIKKYEELRIVLGADPVPPNMTPTCGDQPKPGNKATGCQNTICPMSIDMKVTQQVKIQREQIMDGWV